MLSVSPEKLLVFVLQVLSLPACHSDLMWTSRYMRSRAGRSLMWQLAEAQDNRSITDQKEWYDCDVSVLPEDICPIFTESWLDEDTAKFLKNCSEKADAVLTQIWHLFSKGFLTLVVSPTTANGLLGRGSMFVFSKAQFQKLMGISESWRAGRLLDLGAGDGEVTSVMQTYFDEVYVTEQSPSMQWRLQRKGYKLLGIEEWLNVQEKFDVISCLNLLDRCDKPLTMLSNLHRALKPDVGRVIMAVVLPFSPCVESGSQMVNPSEMITVDGTSWEQQVSSFIKDVFMPAGFIVEQFTKLPYLCEGDLYQDYYVLIDAVFVLRPVNAKLS